MCVRDRGAVMRVCVTYRVRDVPEEDSDAVDADGVGRRPAVHAEHEAV